MVLTGKPNIKFPETVADLLTLGFENWRNREIAFNSNPKPGDELHLSFNITARVPMDVAREHLMRLMKVEMVGGFNC